LNTRPIARGNGDRVTILQVRRKLLFFFNRRRQVRIAHQDVLAGGIEHTRAYGKAFAAMLTLDQSHLRILGGDLADDLCGAVVAAVVHDENFDRVTLLPEVRGDPH